MKDVPNLNHEKHLRVCPLMLTLHLQEFLWTPPFTLAHLEASFPVAVRCPDFSLCFGFLWDLATGFPNTGMLVLRRRVTAGLDEESSDVSCGSDVGACIRTGRTDEKSRLWTYTVASSFVCTFQSAVITVEGYLDTRTVSICCSARALILRNPQLVLFPQVSSKMALVMTELLKARRMWLCP